MGIREFDSDKGIVRCGEGNIIWWLLGLVIWKGVILFVIIIRMVSYV